MSEKCANCGHPKTGHGTTATASSIFYDQCFYCNCKAYVTPAPAVCKHPNVEADYNPEEGSYTGIFRCTVCLEHVNEPNDEQVTFAKTTPPPQPVVERGAIKLPVRVDGSLPGGTRYIRDANDKFLRLEQIADALNESEGMQRFKKDFFDWALPIFDGGADHDAWEPGEDIIHALKRKFDALNATETPNPDKLRRCGYEPCTNRLRRADIDNWVVGREDVHIVVCSQECSRKVAVTLDRLIANPDSVRELVEAVFVEVLTDPVRNPVLMYTQSLGEVCPLGSMKSYVKTYNGAIYEAEKRVKAALAKFEAAGSEEVG